ncbi:intracellular protein transport protein USO1, partial [Reticulomyxa filosa]
IASLFEKQRYQAFDEIKDFMFVMDNLRKIKAVEQRTQRSYFQTIERIFGYVRDVHKDVELMLPLLMKQDPSFDYSRLFECIGCVYRSKWIEERQEERGSNLMDAIKEKLMLHLCELKQSSKCLELDIDHPDHLEQGRKIVEHLEKLNRLESIIPEITNYHKEVGMKIEHAIRATVSTIEHEFSLEKRSVNYHKEIKEQLEKLKVYAESLNHANAYLQRKELKNAHELDSRIQSIEDEIKMNNTDFEKKKNNFDKQIQRIDEKISKLMDIKQSFQQLAIKKNQKNKIPQKSIGFLKKQGYGSIGQVEEQEKRAKAESETLKKKKQELEKTQTQHIEELDKNLKEYQQIQKEFHQLQQKEKVTLDTVSEFLKSRGFSDLEIPRLANNENELIGKIGKYEREIDNIKGADYIFDILNASRTEKVLHYLKKCKETISFTDIVTVNDQREEKKQSTLRQDLVATLCLMERYLQCYGEFVQNQLRWLDYTEISSALNTDTNEFMEKVEVIVSRLYEINKLEKNHPVIFAFFPSDMLRQFYIKLEKTWLNLFDEMMKLEKQSNLPALKAKLFVTKTLSTLDEYAKPSCKFHDLFLKHQEALFNNVIDTGKVLKAMDEHRYTDVAAEIFKINQRKDGDGQAERVLEELKNPLSCSLRALAKTTMMKVLTLGDNEVDLKNVIKLERQLQAIEDAKKCVFKYVEENTIKEIEKIESETKSSIQVWMLKVVATVKAAINCYNFREAEDKIKLTRKITRILGNYFEQISFDDNKEEKAKEKIGKIFNSVDQLEQQLQKVLETVVEKYKRIDLKTSDFNPYASNPPKNLYVKLDKVMHTASTYNYKESWDAIEEDITQKVRDQLQEIRKQVKEFDSRKLETRILFCESVLNSLPKHMQEILGDEIKQCNDEVKYEIENMLKEVEQVIQKRNVQDINELLNRSTPNQKRNIEVGVNKIGQDIVSQMDKQWTEEDTEGALKSFIELAHFIKTLKGKIDLDRYFKQACESLENTFDKYQRNIITNFDTLDQDKSMLKWMERAFTFVISCIDLKDIDTSNMNEKIKELQNKTLDYFTSFQERYKKSMDAKNAEELHVVLDKLKIVGKECPFLQKVLVFMKKKVECGIPEDSSTRKLWSYSEIAHDLNVNLEKMMDDITNEGLVNEKTKSNDMERDRFFSQLKEKLDFVKRVSQWESHLTNLQKLASCEAKLEKEVESLMKRISAITAWSPDDCNQTNLYFSCFMSMQKNGVLSSDAITTLNVDN